MKTAIIAAALLMAGNAFADDLTIGAHVGSWHSLPGRNNVNPGLYVRTADGLQVGAYRNSERGESVYVGQMFSARLGADLEASVMVGAVHGYKRAGLLPVVMPSIRVGGDFGVRIGYIPPAAPKHSHVVHLMAEWSIK